MFQPIPEGPQARQAPRSHPSAPAAASGTPAPAVTGPATPLHPEYLAPATNRTALIRLLQNQATRAEQSGDAARALALYERMTLIAPGYGDVWWQLARMQLQQKLFPSARLSLSAMLEVTRAPDRRQQIMAALAAMPNG